MCEQIPIAGHSHDFIREVCGYAEFETQIRFGGEALYKALAAPR